MLMPGRRDDDMGLEVTGCKLSGIRLRFLSETMDRGEPGLGIKIGEALVRQDVINEHDVPIARLEQKCKGGRLGSILFRLNMATEFQVAHTPSEQLEIPFLDLTG